MASIKPIKKDGLKCPSEKSHHVKSNTILAWENRAIAMVGLPINQVQKNGNK